MSNRYQDDARFSAYVFNELKSDERLEFEEVLKASPEARAYLRELQETAAMMSSLSSPELLGDAPEFSAEAHENVKKSVRARIRNFNVIPFPRKKLAAVSTGVAGVAVASFAFILAGGPAFFVERKVDPSLSNANGQLAQIDVSQQLRGRGSNAPSIQRDSVHLNSPSPGAPIAVASKNPYRVPVYAPPMQFQSRFNENDNHLQKTKQISPLTRSKQLWHSVSNRPVSTIVPSERKASYRRIREALRRGAMPGANVVRIEEMINFFEYPDFLHSDPSQIQVNTEVAQAPWHPSHQLVRLVIGAGAREYPAHAATNMIVLINAASFIDPIKAGALRNSLRVLAKRLTENDTISIHTGVGEENVVVEAARGDELEKIAQAIENWKPSNVKLGVEEIRHAYQLAQKHFLKGGVNRVMLATDSDLTTQVADRGALNRMIENHQAMGISLTVLGFEGEKLAKQSLKSATKLGGGNLYVIDDNLSSQRATLSEISEKPEKLADKIGMAIEFNPKEVFAYRLIGYEKVAGDRVRDMDLKNKEFFAGSQYSVLYEIVPLKSLDSDDVRLRYQRPTQLTKEATSGELLTVNLRYQDTYTKQYKQKSFPLKGTQQSWSAATPEFKFASSVALFGLLLRNQIKTSAEAYELVVDLAKQGKGEDRDGFRKEYLELVRKARSLTIKD